MGKSAKGVFEIEITWRSPYITLLGAVEEPHTVCKDKNYGVKHMYSHVEHANNEDNYSLWQVSYMYLFCFHSRTNSKSTPNTKP